MRHGPPQMNLPNLSNSFSLSPPYMTTLFERRSRVLYKLIDPLPYLEELLNIFCSNTASPKAFLFDTSSKIHVATDACRLSPTLAPAPPPIATTSTPTSGTTPAGKSPLTSSTSLIPGTTFT
ncbi:uncharacterized protein F5147DRAFT_707179 [Suillus discolor]|uniref:GTP-binding protein n=1 Tax=Suillus discolor TaxID=1912936 RepID=A0A9P7F2W6_9AGAM|nr:uncharacterized protein F5147DRAFT_707179 [Suillus discolor]KAG2102504.1 hypothetical protein F5147DRAFT_707179 [Suillus discolor]